MHYANPKAAVCAIVLRGDYVLLSRRAREPAKGLWDLPGGFLEVREEPAEGLARELAEEAGVKLARAELLGAWAGDYAGAATLNLVYVCAIEGEPEARDDVAEFRWFPLRALPKDMAFGHERRALQQVAARALGPG